MRTPSLVCDVCTALKVETHYEVFHLNVMGPKDKCLGDSSSTSNSQCNNLGTSIFRDDTEDDSESDTYVPRPRNYE